MAQTKNLISYGLPMTMTDWRTNRNILLSLSANQTHFKSSMQQASALARTHAHTCVKLQQSRVDSKELSAYCRICIYHKWRTIHTSRTWRWSIRIIRKAVQRSESMWLDVCAPYILAYPYLRSRLNQELWNARSVGPNKQTITLKFWMMKWCEDCSLQDHH